VILKWGLRVLLAVIGVGAVYLLITAVQVWEASRLDQERAKRHAIAQAEHLYEQRYRR